MINKRLKWEAALIGSHLKVTELNRIIKVVFFKTSSLFHMPPQEMNISFQECQFLHCPVVSQSFIKLKV